MKLTAQQMFNGIKCCLLRQASVVSVKKLGPLFPTEVFYGLATAVYVEKQAQVEI